MAKRFDFRFELQRPLVGPVVELSTTETEKILLDQLDEAKGDPTKELWQLAQFYKLTKQHEKALQRLRELIQRLPDPEDRANCVFTMGQAMEQVGDYTAAVRYYKVEGKALAYMGDKTFRKELLAQMSDQAGQEIRESGEDQANRLIKAELQKAGWPEEALVERRKGDAKKVT